MFEYGLEYLDGYFGRDSIDSLQRIFQDLSNPSLPESRRIQLKHEFLSIISCEKDSGSVPCAVSPSGMNFIYCIFDQGQYILLNLWGVTPLFRNWLIYEGELAVTNVQWMEKDRLVTLDIQYIVHDETQKCICHFSNDPSAFVYLTEIQRENRGDSFWGKPEYD